MSEIIANEQLLQALIRYLPPAVARAMRSTRLPWQAPTLTRGAAAVLFMDVSGFTVLTEKLAAYGPHGAEELTLLLNRYFSRMIGLLENEGGEVVQFSGDALLTVFPVAATETVEKAALAANVRRAWQAATQMQIAMGEFSTLATSVGPVELGMKISIGAGEVFGLSLGGVEGRWPYLIAGDPLRQVAEAEHHAQRGEIVLSPEAQNLLPTELAPPHPLAPFHWPDAPTEAIAALRAQVPQVISYRLEAGQADWLAELRHLSVLFLGVSGLDYEAPEALAQAQAWIAVCQGIVYRFEGILNKLLVDDKGTIGIVLFGAPPLSHQDDSLRAVRCALALHQAAVKQKLQLSIGLTTGQVFAGPVGSETRREYTVMGDAVNLAARLMQLAAKSGGGLRGDHATFHATQDAIHWEALPPQMVKGKAAAVRVYQPLALHTSRAPRREGRGLVGRAAEMAQIERALEASLAGRLQVVCLEAEAGLGKSRLVTELTHRMREHGVAGLFSNGDALEQGAYNIWREIFRGYFDLENAPDASTYPAIVLAHLADIAPDLLPRAPLLNDLLDLDLPETDLIAHLEPKLRQASLSALLVDLLTLWANERPLVLLFEDAQWQDSLSWQLTLQAARSLSDRPVLLMLTLPPLPDLPADHPYLTLRELPQCVRVSLGPLAPAELTALAAARLGVDDLPAEVAHLIEQRASGNPFIAEELALSLRERGIIRIEEGECVLAGYLSELQVPDTLQGLVLSRIDRLPAGDQFTLKIASVIGRTFGHTTLRDIHPPPVNELQIHASLEYLTQHELVETLTPPTLFRSHAFRQAVTQEVTYSTLLQTQARELHERVARWYEDHTEDDQTTLSALLAYHWRQAHNAERELHYATRASQELAASYANNEALSFLERALQLAQDPAQRYDLLWLRMELHDRVGDRQAQQADLAQLQTLAAEHDDFKRQAQLANAQADYYRNMSDYPAALETLQRARALAQQARDPAAEARSLTLWGQVLEHQGAYREAKDYFQQSLVLYRQIQYQRGEANNLSRLSNISRYLGDKLAARDYALEALRLRQSLGDRASEATSLNNLGLICAELGEVEAARAYRQQAAQIARAIGDRASEALSLNVLGLGHLMQGDYATAQRYLQQALRLHHTMGARLREAECHNMLGMVWRDIGDDRQAQQYFEQALVIQEAIGNRSYATYTYLNLGLARLQNDLTAARQCYAQALAYARETGNRDAEAYALSYQGTLSEHEKDWAAAATAYQAALAIRHELKATAAAIEDTAGLARVALVQGGLADARQHADTCLAYMTSTGVEGIEFPIGVYLTCYDVYQASQAQAEARQALENAHALLVQRANAISDPALREGMLQKVPANRRVMSEWSALSDQSRA